MPLLNKPPLTQRAYSILSLPRWAKRFLALSVDASAIVFSLWLALSMRFETPVEWTAAYVWLAIVSMGIALPVFVVQGLYRAIFRYAGSRALTVVFRAVAYYTAAFFCLVSLIGWPSVPRSVGIMQPMLLLAFIFASRAAVRYSLGGTYRKMLRRQALGGVLIYGAGAAGRQLALALANSDHQRLVGFIDDNAHLQGHTIDDWTVLSPQELPEAIAEANVKEVLLALPSVGRQRRNEIIDSLRQFPVHVYTLPDINDLAAGKVALSDLRELDIQDLLGRDTVAPNTALLNRNILGQVVMVTGAGGSIGSELCRQILKCQPKQLLLVEQSEFALYQTHQELSAASTTNPAQQILIPLIASAQNERRMHEVMATWKPHTVYHAAAYKHVPLVEHNPAEGVRNNVWGTWVCARVAAKVGVRNFVLISTDKAVRPTNIMGASKRLAEMVLQSKAQLQANAKANAHAQTTEVTETTQATGTCFSMVRFGNVLGSSGSVVPLFREQIKQGGPITLTHADINRFFMTIPEAAQLVIQAGAMATGGDVFVLDMGEPVRIYDLATRMVELSGLTVKDEFNPAGEIEIQVTGLRPGEKLYEELLIGNNPQPTHHPRIMKANETIPDWPALQAELAHLDMALTHNNVHTIKDLLRHLVHGYETTEEVVDWVHLAQSTISAESNQGANAPTLTNTTPNTEPCSEPRNNDKQRRTHKTHEHPAVHRRA